MLRRQRTGVRGVFSRWETPRDDTHPAATGAGDCGWGGMDEWRGIGVRPAA